MPEIILTHFTPFEAEKCATCGGKCPRHPAVLRILKSGETHRHLICEKCDTVLTKLAHMAGLGACTFTVEDEPMQTRMDLGESENHNDTPPTADVATRIRALSALVGSAYKAGQAAFTDGDAIDTNPHNLDSQDPALREAAKRWNNGWLEAKVEALREGGDTDEADELAKSIEAIEEPTDVTVVAPADDVDTSPLTEEEGAKLSDAPSFGTAPRAPIPLTGRRRRKGSGKPN